MSTNLSREFFFFESFCLKKNLKLILIAIGPWSAPCSFDVVQHVLDKTTEDKMKNVFGILMSMVAVQCLMSTAFASAEQPPRKDVVVAINDAFVPGGFDSEADAYVVVSGIFPNGCYRWKDANVQNVNAFEHEIKSVASVGQGMCLMVLVPFSRDVRLGKLNAGKHTLRFMSGDGTYLEKSMVVE